MHTARENLHATRMRGAARLILLTAALSRDEDTPATTGLLLTLAVVLDALAEVREAHRLLHQTQSARHAAQRLRSWTPPPAAAPAAMPAVSGPDLYHVAQPVARPHGWYR